MAAAKTAPTPTQQEQAAFSDTVAGYLGFDPRVVYAWAQLETGGAPYGGFHNWLNLRPYPGDPYVGVSPGNFEEYANVAQATAATKRRLSQPFAADIRKAGGPGHTPAEEIAAIAASGWDVAHYGGPGGPSLAAEFSSLYGAQALDAPASSHVVKPGGGQSQSSIVDKLTGVPGSGGPTSIVTGAISSVEGFLKEYAPRVAEVVGGALLILVSLFILTRGSIPSPLGGV